MPGLVGFEHFHFQLAMHLLQVQRDKACVEFMCSIFSKHGRFCLFHHFTVFHYCHVIMCCCFLSPAGPEIAMYVKQVPLV